MSELHSTLDSAYRHGLRNLRDFGGHGIGSNDPTSVGSEFGSGARTVRELFETEFRLTDPRARLLNSPARKPNLIFSFAQTLWFLSGSDLVDPIAYYNARARSFSDDGVSLNGAYGKRLFHPLNGESPIQLAIKILREDSGSRRAFVPILQTRDLAIKTRDVPCTIGFGFSIRDNALHMFAHMRSQSAAKILPYDVFSATMIQELMACELGVDLGSYYHHCQNLHYYEDEYGIVAAEIEANLEPLPPMPGMPSGTNLASIDPVLKFEAKTRESAIRGTLDLDYTLKEIETLGTYWGQVARILLLQSIKGAERQRVFSDIEPIYKELLR